MIWRYLTQAWRHQFFILISFLSDDTFKVAYHQDDAFEPKRVKSNYIKYGVNSLWFGGFEWKEEWVKHGIINCTKCKKNILT